MMAYCLAMILLGTTALTTPESWGLGELESLTLVCFVIFCLAAAWVAYVIHASWFIVFG